MNRKPSTVFLNLALVMMVLFVGGMIAVWELAQPRTEGDDWTGTAIIRTNDAVLTLFAGATESPGPSVVATLTAWASYIYDVNTKAADLMTALANRTPSILRGMATPTSTPSPSIAGTSPTARPCYFNWATQALPDLTAEVQAAMDDAGLENVTVTASAYGENCYANDTNEVLYFAAMQTDFHVTAQVEDIEDGDALGDLTLAIITVLNDYPPGEAPGPMPGQISLLYEQGARETRLTISVERMGEVLGWGYTGETLWSALVGEG